MSTHLLPETFRKDFDRCVRDIGCFFSGLVLLTPRYRALAYGRLLRAIPRDETAMFQKVYNEWLLELEENKRHEELTYWEWREKYRNMDSLDE